MRPQRRFTAFVSYSHADRVVGARFFRFVDAYRPPKRLVGTEGTNGLIPARLYPCFRDREELTVSRDVRAELDAALFASEHLIVLCSAAAAASRWVEHEVKTFAAAKGAGRIHAVLAPGASAENSIPAAFAEVGIPEPLASDLGADGDGWRDGSLKVVAAILGVQFGELKDRERARSRAQGRRIATVGAILSTTLVGGCGAGWVALDRSEAAQLAFIGAVQSVFDEQGVTLTTSDLNGEFRGLRRFRETLTGAAFNLAPDSQLLLQEEIRINLIYARHYIALNDSSEALRALTRGERALDRLIERGDIGETAQLYAGVHQRVLAEVEGSRGREAARLHALERSIAILRALSIDGAQRELAQSLDKLGEYEQGRRRFEQAKAAYDEVARLQRALIQVDPSDQQLVSDHLVTLMRIGDLAFDQADFVGAAVAYREANERAAQFDSISQCEREDGGRCVDIRARRTLYLTEDRLALLALRTEDFDAADAHFARAEQLARDLGDYDPGNTIMSRDFAIAQLQAARIAGLRGRRAEALARLSRGMDVAKALEAADPNNRDRAADVIRFEIARAIMNQEGDWSRDLLQMDGPSLVRTAVRLRVNLSTVNREYLEIAHREEARMRASSRPAPACADPRYC